MDAQTFVVVGTFVLTLLAFAGGIVWKLSRVETSLRADIVQARDEVEARSDKSIHDVGESLQAMRQKIADVELDMLKNYVRRDGYYKERAELSTDIKELGDRIEKRLDKMEAKIDEK
jgi:hypothetical protein